MTYDYAISRHRSMMGLSQGEQLVVWGIRKIVAQQGVDGSLPAEFEAALDLDSAEGLRIFCSFFRLLGQAARKPYEIAPPCTLGVTPDEQRILTLFAAGQLGVASGDFTLLDSHLLWLAAGEHRPALCRIILRFARVLTEHGHRIPVAQDWPQFALPDQLVPVRLGQYHAQAMRL